MPWGSDGLVLEGEVVKVCVEEELCYVVRRSSGTIN
jgi:hypothetical protein